VLARRAQTVVSGRSPPPIANLPQPVGFGTVGGAVTAEVVDAVNGRPSTCAGALARVDLIVRGLSVSTRAMIA